MASIEEMEDAQPGTLHCPQCDASNLPQEKFCGKCGASLWENCLGCGNLGAAARTFCAVCGTNLGDAAAAEHERLEDEFRKVAKLRAACSFDDALCLLVPISKRTHPRLAEHALHAGRLIHELVAERDRCKTDAEIDGQRAQKAFESYDFDRAAEILAQIPAPLRSKATLDLESQVAARRQEIAALTEDVRMGVQRKRVLDVASKIDRLLELKPDHPVGGQLAEQVQRHLLAAAEKRLAEYRYDDALGLLERIPAYVRSPKAEERLRQVKELAWLTWDLRTAPVVDATLASIAKQLRLLAPGDAQAVKLAGEVQRRTQSAEGRNREKPPSWARPPQPTALGAPVEQLTSFRHLGRSETLEHPELLRDAGRLATACGLALTGLREAAMPINLLNSGGRGVLKWVGHLVRSLSDQPAWGIDLGPSGLKAVKLAWDEEKQQVVIEAVALLEHAKPLGHAANEAEERKLVEETLEKFLDAHETKSTQVCLGIPGRMSLMLPLDLPPVEMPKLLKLVQYEARSEFPVPLDDLAWDFQLYEPAAAGSNGSAKTESEDGRQGLLIGARRAAAQRFLQPCERLGLRVDVLQTDVVGLHNLLIYEYYGEEREDSTKTGGAASASVNSAVAAIDVGCDVTNIVVSSPYSLWFHGCGVAGQSFTRALVREFHYSTVQAEEKKRAPESAGRLSELFEAWSPPFQDLLKESRASLASYAEAVPDRPVRQIVGMGGGFSLHGLLRGFRCGR